MDTVTLTLEGETEAKEVECDITHDHYTMKPVVLSTWQHTQLGACPAKSTVIPESQVGHSVVKHILCKVYEELKKGTFSMAITLLL